MISDILINYIKNAVCRFENEIADMCRKTAEPVFLTKNGEGDLVVMDIETYNRREKMLKLCSDKKKYYIGGYSLAGLFSMGSIPNRYVYRNRCGISVRLVYLAE